MFYLILNIKIFILISLLLRTFLNIKNNFKGEKYLFKYKYKLVIIILKYDIKCYMKNDALNPGI